MYQTKVFHNFAVTQIIRLIVIAIAYFITGRLGLELAVIGSNITLIWLPTGIAVAALFRWGYRDWPAVWLGALAVNLAIGSSLLIAFGISIGNTLAPIAVVALLRRWHFNHSISSWHDVPLFVAAAAFGMVLSATGGVAILSITHLVPWTDVGWAWLAWWLGDTVGVIVGGMALITFERNAFMQLLRGPHAQELLASALTVAAVSLAMINIPPQPISHIVLTPLVMLSLVWIALRLDAWSAATAMLILSLSAAIALAIGHGQFIDHKVHVAIAELWAYMITLSIVTMLMSAFTSERKQAENALRASEKKYQSLVNEIGEKFVIYSHDLNGKLLYVSDSIINFTGFSKESLLGQNWGTVVNWLPGVLEESQSCINQLAIGKMNFVQHEMSYLHSDGKVQTLHVSSHAVRDQNGALVSIDGIVEDITERKQAEQQLQNSERHFQRIVATVPAMLYDYILYPDGSSKFLYVSKNCHDILELDDKELITDMNLFWKMVHQDDVERIHEEDVASNRTGRIFNVEIRIITKSGRMKWVQLSSRSNPAPPGELAIWSGYILDVTWRKQAELELYQAKAAAEASEERMRTIIAAEPECVKILDQNGNLLQMNPAGLAMIEADALDQVSGQSVFNLIAREYRQDYIALHRRVIAGEPQQMEYEILGLKGSRRWLETHAVRVQEDGKWLHLAVTRDISQRKQTENELIQAHQTAEAANIAKSAFLANMSHEIRTPMNSILGMAQMLLQPDLTDHSRQEYAQIILNSGRLLLNLLNDILDLSKVEAGKIKLELTPWQPQRILDEIGMLFAENAKSKGLQLNCNWSGSATSYLIDPYRLQQMLSNLVSNAIKFTEHGQIHVTMSEISRNEQTALLEFAVTDTGIGIAPDNLQLLFAPFTQADSSTTRRFGGTGLGLSIVKSLAKKMGGDTGCESTLGQGSRFWFRIQADIVVANEMAADRNLPQVTIPEQFHGRILVAEDDLANAQVIQAMLQQLGLTIEVVSDGQQAVDTVMAGTTANLILMDIQMPILDGCTVTQKIRQWEIETGQPRLPIIALTASVFESNRQYCLNVGMDGLLAKPIMFDDLKQVLSQWLDVKTVVKPNAVILTSQPITKPVDKLQVMAILHELIPALMQNNFDAIFIFNKLREVLANTDLAIEIELIAKPLAQLEFSLVIQQLQQIMTARGWKVENL